MDFAVPAHAVMGRGGCLSLPAIILLSPVLTASAGMKHPALAALWDSLAPTWARSQAHFPPPPPFGLFFAQLGQAQHPHPPSSLLPELVGMKGASAAGKPCLGYCVSFEDRFGFSLLSGLLYGKKKAKLNRLQPVLSCHTTHQCQRCPRRRQRPGHSKGHRQGLPGDSGTRAVPSLALVGKTKIKPQWRCEKGNTSGSRVSGSCLLENTHFPPNKMEELVLQLVLPREGLGVTVSLSPVPQGSGRAAPALTFLSLTVCIYRENSQNGLNAKKPFCKH